MRRTLIAAAIAAAAVIARPATVGAQTFLTGFGGATFGEDAPDAKLNMGAGLSFLGDVAGIELEVGYTPDFYDESNTVALVGDNNVTTVMFSVMIAPSLGDGRVRPYGIFGAGLIRTRIADDDLFDRVSTNDTGLNVGGGVMVLLSDHVGVRGDLRYFRSFQDPPDSNVDLALGKFDFWRGTAGLLVKF